MRYEIINREDGRSLGFFTGMNAEEAIKKCIRIQARQRKAGYRHTVGTNFWAKEWTEADYRRQKR